MQAPSSILVADDDADTRRLLDLALQKEGFQVVLAEDGTQSLDLFSRQAFDLVVLDWMMPGLDGLEVCPRIQRDTCIPVLLLTARNNEEDILAGFASGAYDYVVKPFRHKELTARIRSILQHSPGRPFAEGQNLAYAALSLDPNAQQVCFEGKILAMTPTNYRLLLYFMRNPGRAIRKEELLQVVWAFDEIYGDLNIVEAAIKRLRRILRDNPKNPRYLKTIRGIGYQFGERG